MLQRVLLATFSNALPSCHSDAFCPPFPHFDPFGTEFCEPGWDSHPEKFKIARLRISNLNPIV
jgi:hypothetical protein